MQSVKIVVRAVCLGGPERGRGRQIVWRGLDLVVVVVVAAVADVVEIEIEDVVGCD